MSEELRHRGSARVVGVGVPWSAGLLIQEYWDLGAPAYAIANAGPGAVSLGLAEWTGQVGRAVLGPWEIGAGGVRREDASSLVTEQSGALLAVVRDGASFSGLLRAPRPIAPPPGAAPGVVTVEGVNGTGDRNTRIYCVQPDLFLPPTGATTLRFYVPGGTGALYLGEPQPPSPFPGAAVEDVRCGTLPVERAGSTFVVGESPPGGPDHHEVAVTVHVPRQARMATVAVRVRSAAGTGFTLARGFLVGAPGA